jgi:hypothetical protein
MFDSFHDEVTEDEDDEAMVSQVSQWVQVMEELLIIHCSIFLKFVILLHSHGTGRDMDSLFWTLDIFRIRSNPASWHRGTNTFSS